MVSVPREDAVPEQGSLFADASERPEALGHAKVTFIDSSSILTKATGFMDGYDYTLNPYSGCSFGCTYCYAAFFTREPKDQETWGRWVRVKETAVRRLQRMRKPLAGTTIYMSSVTDPYQPIERSIGLTRAILEELVTKQPRLVIQTRSPLVTRDIDLLTRFDHVRVNMTVTTDVEPIRRAFEPWCPTAQKRLDAIAEVAAAGIPTCITMTPLLPVEDASAFAAALLATGVPRFVVQPFHVSQSRFTAGTSDAARALLAEYGWTETQYRAVVRELRNVLPRLDEGREGFEPA